MTVHLDGSAPIRVFLVDDHEVVRRGVAALLQAVHDVVLVGDADRFHTALRRIRQLEPDVVILDVRLPDGNGIDLCRQVRSLDPRIRCLIFTAYDDDEAQLSAALAGAGGYVLKEVDGFDLVSDVRAVASGLPVPSRGSGEDAADTLRRRVEEDPRLGSLGMRHRQILTLIGEGLTNRQIGERLGLAEKTVKNYVSGLLRALGMERRTQAAVYGATLRRP
jgi:two-component system response regulator DevR